MLNYPTYWITPANWSLDTSFDQWSGFNKQVLWVAEYWDEYVFWWDNGTNYYSAYQWVSSINSNKISPFFRVRKDNKLPDTNSILWGNLNAINTVVNPFCVWGGYIYAVWPFTKYGNNVAINVVKISQDDMSFVAGNTWVWFSNTSPVSIWYANWKIFLTAFSNITYNWGTSTMVTVLNPDLTVDTTLTSFFVPNSFVWCIYEQTDGKTIMVWNFTTIWWTTRNRIVRYNTDWTVDSTFSTNVWTWPNSWFWTIDIKQLSSWKIVLWGWFATFNGTASKRIIILNTDWTISNAVASWFNTWNVWALAIDSSDNIFCWWNFASFAWNTRRSLVKLSSTLTFDATFNALINTWTITSLVIDSSILYIACDSTLTTNWSAVSWVFSTDLVNGTLNSDFQWWINVSSRINKLYVIWNYIYIHWWNIFSTYWRLRGFDWEFTTFASFIDKNWTLTQSLDKFNSSWVGTINYAIKDWNNLYVWSSDNTSYWLVNSIGVVKFDDKIVDNTYVANIPIQLFSMIYDSWIIVWWSFTSPKNRIVKLNSTGWVDATFDVWTWFDAQVDWITKLSNWNYLVSGNFTTYKWVATNRICLLDNVGTKIWTFIEWTWLNSNPSAKTLELSNWNYLVYGNLATYKWTACNRAIMLDATGTQVSWLASNFNWTIRKVIEHNGKVYFTWDFTTFWATTANRIACIDLATWTLENIFWTGLNWTWNDIIVDNWGKLVVVWNFTTYNDNPVWYVARIFI